MTDGPHLAPKGLHLWAQEGDDLAVISTLLQDAITNVGQISYRHQERRLALIVNRFRWDRETRRNKAGDDTHQRIQSGISFDHVLRVQARNIDMTDRQGLLALLAITAQAQENNTEILLRFSAGASIRLEAECIDCRLDDLGDAWQTEHRPHHDLDTVSATGFAETDDERH